MTRPSPKKSPNYDYEEIRELRSQPRPDKWSWEKLGELYGKNYRNVARWYEREKERRILAKLKPVAKPKKREKSPVMSELGEIRRTKYGEIEPTGTISDLSHLDWMRKHFGSRRYEWDLPYLTALQDMIWDGEWELGHLPRYGGKSTTYMGITARELVERQKPVMGLCSPKRPKVLFRGMINRILRSPSLRKDYGDIIAVEEGRPQVDKTDRMMWINQESEFIDYPYEDPLYRVATRETDIIGSHPYHIHFEDMSQLESEGETERLIEWYEDVLSPMLSLYKDDAGRLTGTSTRKNPDDFDNYLMTKQSWTNKNTHYRAIEGYIPTLKDVTLNDEGRVIAINEDVLANLNIYNPYIDPIKLVDIAIRTPVAFASQYQNDPIPRGGRYFLPKEFIINTLPLSTFSRCQEFVDPAWGKSAAASETAMFICAVNEGKLVFLDASIGNYDTVLLEDEAVRLHTEFNAVGIHMEDNYLQITTRYNEDSKLRSLRGARTFSSKGDKLERIDSLKAPFVTSRIEFHVSCNFLSKIKAQFLRYNRKKGAWDILDCISMAYEYMFRYMRKMRKGSKLKVGVMGARFDE